MRVEVLMETLRVSFVPKEWIESIKRTIRGVVIPCPQILLADAGVELFAAVEVLCGCGSHFEAEGFAVGGVVKDLRRRGDGGDGTGEVGEDAGGTVAVVVEDERFAVWVACGGEGGLADLVVANGVDDLLDFRLGTGCRVDIVDGFFEHLLIAGVVTGVDQVLRNSLQLTVSSRPAVISSVCRVTNFMIFELCFRGFHF